MEQQIKEAYEQLPPQIKKAILNSNWEEEIGKIGKKFSLRLDQVSTLENNVVLVMLGLLDTNDFVSTINSSIEIFDKNITNKILSEIEATIFTKIRNALVASTSNNNDNLEKSHISNQNVSADLLINTSTPTEQTIIEPAPVQETKSEITESRDKILSEIENPALMQIAVGNTTPAIVAETPKTPLSAPIAPTKTAPARVDPYREPIE